MGAFKPLLPWGNKSVIESCISALKDGGANEIIVVVGHRAEEITARLAAARVQTAENREPGSEMGVSIARGVESLPDSAEAILIALTDQPAVPAEVVATMIATWQRTHAPVILPEYKGRSGHPILIGAALQDRLLNLDPEQGLRGLLGPLRELTLRVPVSSPFIARDMDTWQDYEALHQEVFGYGPPERTDAA
jgi:CTP:molybdopterin cytidylyltransferase MocA